jgi:hypothetical protein
VDVRLDEAGQQGHLAQVVEVVGRRRVGRQIPRGQHGVDQAALDTDGRVVEPARQVGVGHAGGAEQGGHRRRVGGRE